MGGNTDNSPISIQEVKGSGIREFRDHKGTVEVGQLGLSTGFRGLREGGVNIIIITIAQVVEDGLEVGRERHIARGVVEKGGGKREMGENNK